ncbi:MULTISPECIES: TetR/AcrR family transcriptional regulator [Saccharothrix]|uniref:TetR/AcrR family transcriptional regulator n=1 Tax=Saccharothrix TaxID=2071 RepID=UPI00093E251F|nr:TetR/AcrR family transcriptional regulator [Saccharothrix sp. CB00851]
MAVDSQHPPRRRRRDAVNNRNQILEASAAVFAERGLSFDVREIARRAGVGMGTLYRHFPTKGALLDAVLDEDFTSWSATVENAAADPDPWLGLARYLEESLELLAQHRALLDGLSDPLVSTPGMDECRDLARPLLTGIVDRARSAGVLRPDVTADDVSLLLIGMGRIIQLTEEAQPGTWRRQLSVVLDGLRATPQP